DVSIAGFAEVIVFDVPELEITELKAPKKISYKENATVSFVLNKKSFSSPKNVVIELQSSAKTKEYRLDSLDESKEFEFLLWGKELPEISNSLTVKISYEDLRGNRYFKTESFSTNLENIPVLERVVLFFKNLLRSS
ncbi:hypothetical protein KY308_00345, partial [Candidatus Woesearchaeota archaeon]|nr:hypothetical protein [Candidatus Woesearchaeota archaeon]